MQFLYDENAGQPKLVLKNNSHHYLKNVKRVKANSQVFVRNLQDGILYCYQILSIDKRQIELKLEHQQHLVKTAKQFLRLACCVIDIKVIEKLLPALNQLGLASLAFIHCQYSQGHFQVNIDRLKQILINSCMQCGRSDLMQIEHFDSLKAFLALYQQVYILDFQAAVPQLPQQKAKNQTIDYKSIQNLVIGPEGGFSSSERADFNQHHLLSLDHELILKSEVASLVLTAKILL